MSLPKEFLRPIVVYDCGWNKYGPPGEWNGWFHRFVDGMDSVNSAVAKTPQVMAVVEREDGEVVVLSMASASISFTDRGS